MKEKNEFPKCVKVIYDLSVNCKILSNCQPKVNRLVFCLKRNYSQHRPKQPHYTLYTNGKYTHITFKIIDLGYYITHIYIVLPNGARSLNPALLVRWPETRSIYAIGPLPTSHVTQSHPNRWPKNSPFAQRQYSPPCKNGLIYVNFPLPIN